MCLRCEDHTFRHAETIFGRIFLDTTISLEQSGAVLMEEEADKQMEGGGGGVNISTSFSLFADNFYEIFQDAQFFFLL